MLLHRLFLTAVGPFSGQELSFCANGDPRGLHVIHGPNEAGKSSALRALRALLFGFHARTDEDFLHAYNDLRVGALVSRNGEAPRHFNRRKGRANTLLDDAGQPVADTELTGLYRHVTDQTFDRFHGITHAELIEGGAKLLDGDGELGESLFGASDQGRLLGELRARAEEDAKKHLNSQNNGTLRDAIETYRRLRDTAEAKVLDPLAWRKVNDELAAAGKEQAEINAALAEMAERIAHLRRVLEARPHLGRRRLTLDRLRELQDLPDLPEDFDDRAKRTIAELGEAKRQLAARQTQLAATETELADIADPPMLLARSSAVDSLARDVRTAEDARAALPALRAEAEAAQRMTERLRQDVAPDVDPDDLASLRLPRDRREHIATLAEAHPELQRQLASAKEIAAKTKRRLETLGETEAASPDAAGEADALALALHRSRAEGEVSDQLEDLRRERDEAAERAENIATRLAPRLLKAPAKVTTEAIAELSVPGEEVIAALAQQLADVGRAVETARDAVESREDEARRADEELRYLREDSEVPEESDLAEARQRRDALRQKATNAWQTRQPFDATVAHDHDRAVADADAIADAMRTAAEQVTKLKVARRACDRATSALEVARHRFETREAEHKAKWREWVDTWRTAGVDAGTVAEMTAWRREYHDLNAAVAEIDKIDRKAARITDAATGHVDVLSRLLASIEAMPAMKELPADPPARLSALQAAADRAVSEARKARILRERREEDRREAQRDVAEANQDLERAREELAEWQTQWETALAAASRPRNESPTMTATALRAVQELLDADDEANRLRVEVEEAEQVTAAFDARVAAERAAFADLLADDDRRALVSADAGGAVALLRQHVDAARECAAKREQLEKTRAQLAEDRAAAERELEQVRTTLAELAQSAGVAVDDLAGLESSARRHAERRELQRTLEAIRERLAEIGGGTRDVDALVREAEEHADVDEATLVSQIEDAEASRDELQQRRDTLQQTIGGLLQQRSGMDGRGDAADAAEEAAAVLGRVEAEVNAYARAALTAEALRRAVDTHRSTQQAPLLRAASCAFATLTAGHFRELRVFVDDRDRRLLGGVRRKHGEGDAPIPVAGMSDGTRDALYLALRLAHLRADAQANGPFPLVMDDVLVNADEERTSATLAALRDFATEAAGQVIYFTHHRHVADLAHQAGGHVQQLQRHVTRP